MAVRNDGKSMRPKMPKMSTYVNIWGLPWSWGYPNSWKVFVRKHPVKMDAYAFADDFEENVALPLSAADLVVLEPDIGQLSMRTVPKPCL